MISSLAVAAATALVAWWWRAELGETLTPLLWVACLMLPVCVRLHLAAAALTALKRVAAAQVPFQVVRPLVLVVAVLLAAVLVPARLGPGLAMVLHLGAILCAWCVCEVLLARSLPPEAAAAEPSYATGQWRRVLVPLIVLSGLGPLADQLDILFVGALRGAAEAGVYAAAMRLSQLLLFGALAVKAIALPLFAESFAQGAQDRLQRAATMTAQAIVLFTLPLGIGLILFGNRILSLFGPGFAAGYVPLVILTGAYLFNAAVGLVTVLMTMTSGEKAAARVLAVACALGVVLNLLLIPRLGIIGAAAARALTLACWNLGMLVYVVRDLGINPTAFAWKGDRG